MVTLHLFPWRAAKSAARGFAIASQGCCAHPGSFLIPLALLVEALEQCTSITPESVECFSESAAFPEVFGGEPMNAPRSVRVADFSPIASRPARHGPFPASTLSRRRSTSWPRCVSTILFAPNRPAIFRDARIIQMRLHARLEKAALA